MLREALRNLTDWLGLALSIPWRPSDDWPEVRLRATFVARRRIRRYRRARRTDTHRRTTGTLPWRHHG